jgi:hypothetical protein
MYLCVRSPFQPNTWAKLELEQVAQPRAAVVAPEDKERVAPDDSDVAEAGAGEWAG